MSGWAKPSNTIHDPQSYQFVDISNNNAQRGEVHYKTSLFVRDHVLFSKHPRPPYGLGLNHVALHHIQSMRLLTGEMAAGQNLTMERNDNDETSRRIENPV